MTAVLHLRGRIAEADWPGLVRFVADAIPIYEAPGGIRVRLLRSREDDSRFIEAIEYDSTALLEEDDLRTRSDTRIIELLQRWRQYLLNPVDVETYVDVTPR